MDSLRALASKVLSLPGLSQSSASPGTRVVCKSSIASSHLREVNSFWFNNDMNQHDTYRLAGFKPVLVMFHHQQTTLW